MTTKAGVGFSQKVNSKEAGIEAAQAAMQKAGVERCDLVILFAGAKHDPVLLREGVRSIIGVEPRLFGGAVVGVITNENLGTEGYEVGVAVISSATMKADMFIAKNMVASEYEAGLSLGKQIKNNNTSGDPSIFLVYDVCKSGLGSEGSSLTMATALLAGMSESFENWPTAAGCGIMANMQWTPPFQYFDNEIAGQSAMALVFSGATRMDTIIMHGCKPASRYFTVTKADRNVVLELDGKPTMDVIQELIGESDKNWQDYPIYITLGVNQGDKFGDYKEEEYSIRLCADLDRERRGLVMFGDDLVPAPKSSLCAVASISTTSRYARNNC